MRLADLHPRWFSEAGRHGQGLTFDCPAGCGMRLGVAFDPPIDGGAPSASENRGNEGRLWTRVSGDSFESLTLSPSIDASQVKRRDGETDAAYAARSRPCTAGGQSCWHGFITNGQVT